MARENESAHKVDKYMKCARKNSGTGDSGENCAGLTWVQRAMVRAYDQEQATKKFDYSVTDPCLEA